MAASLFHCIGERFIPHGIWRDHVLIIGRDEQRLRPYRKSPKRSHSNGQRAIVVHIGFATPGRAYARSRMNTDLFSGIRRERRPRRISRRSLGRSGCGAVAVTVRFDPSLTLMMMSIDSLQAYYAFAHHVRWSGKRVESAVGDTLKREAVCRCRTAKPLAKRLPAGTDTQPRPCHRSMISNIPQVPSSFDDALDLRSHQLQAIFVFTSIRCRTRDYNHRRHRLSTRSASGRKEITTCWICNRKWKNAAEGYRGEWSDN